MKRQDKCTVEASAGETGEKETLAAAHVQDMPRHTRDVARWQDGPFPGQLKGRAWTFSNGWGMFYLCTFLFSQAQSCGHRSAFNDIHEDKKKKVFIIHVCACYVLHRVCMRMVCLHVDVRERMCMYASGWRARHCQFTRDSQRKVAARSSSSSSPSSCPPPCRSVSSHVNVVDVPGKWHPSLSFPQIE